MSMTGEQYQTVSAERRLGQGQPNRNDAAAGVSTRGIA